ncbi:MAG: 4-hydroxy-tetrahydrodipicolinate synthase [Haloarculaceae archaeon]
MTRTFTGTYPAIVTPFHKDGSIDFEGVREEVRRLEAAGVDGIVACGSTGESSTLSHDEHIEVIDAVVDEADTPVIGGTGSNATREALSLSKRAADAGVDGLLLVSSYYNLPEAEGIEHFYQTIADEVDVPQVIYNVPGRTARNIPVETTVELASHENVVGYKAASGDVAQISEVVERTRDEEFTVLSGDDPVTIPAMSVGGRGVISVAANVAPTQVCEMVDAALDEDYARAREVHHELGPLFRGLFVETNPIPVKEAVEIQGHREAVLRPPLTKLSAEHRADLEAVLADLA